MRAYSLPLTGEMAELRVGRGAVSRLRLSADHASLFVCCADGSVTVLDIQLELGRAGKRCGLILGPTAGWLSQPRIACASSWAAMHHDAISALMKPPSLACMWFRHHLPCY